MTISVRSAGATNGSYGPDPDHEVMIIGAGVCGIYLAYKMAELGTDFTLLERGDDVGGTWFKNRYPGCRFDSESETYGYSFSKELLSEWNWTERFAPRHETERYLQHVVERFDLRKYMRFNADVEYAHWQDDTGLWKVGLKDGTSLTSRYLLTAIGLLSTPTPPRYPGVSEFKGQSFHTYDYPADGVDYSGKRVAVIGTGATGVQFISAVADQVGSLTVFQRRPNWCAPLNNGPISQAEMDSIKKRYDEIFAACHATPSGFLHDADPRKMFEVPAEERDAFWEELYRGSGFGIWLGNFKDVLTNNEANAEFSKFIEQKIRSRVKDQAVADKLVPRDHGFGTRRVPMETKYYEVFNRENVRLIDISETPIECITETGIRTSSEALEFDIIVYATGFNAVTGAFESIDFRGVAGESLMEKWRGGPVAAFGLAVSGFPNLLTVAGPLSGSVATNFPRGIEEAVNWCSDFIQYVRDHDVERFEAKGDAEVEWVDHVQDMAKKILFAQQQSWFTGYNSNIDRGYAPKAIVYAGGAQRYRRAIFDQAQRGYPAFKLQTRI